MEAVQQQFSKADQSLVRYMELQEEIKRLTAEKSRIANDIKAHGSHYTRNFICTVKESSYMSLPGREALESVFGFEEVSKVLVERQRVTISIDHR